MDRNRINAADRPVGRKPVDAVGRGWQNGLVQRLGLIPHSRSSSSAIEVVQVTVARTGTELCLRYAVVPAAAVVWPVGVAAAPSDGLWRTTCFELFLQLDDAERYVEFNFSPSSAWAAYSFDGYRDNAMPLACAPFVSRVPEGVEVALDIGTLPHGELRMALTAVIEEVGGLRSYWSLAHPPGPPDFHHQACFAARLPAPNGP